ncbi:MAG: hypothetical protein ACP5VE_08415 [Chthonomonadales bacterium]
MAQTVLTQPDPAEHSGSRPYEMVWAHRVETAPPTVTFFDLNGWTMRVEGGAQAELRPSRAQDVWGRPVGRLRYRGDGSRSSQPRILLIPASPIPLPRDAAGKVDCLDMWVYGNRWDWENPPDTPPVRIVLNLRSGTGADVPVVVDTIRWKEWWLMHRKLPANLTEPASLISIEVDGGWQPEWRELYLDSIRFYHEVLAPLHFAPRPKRNIALFPGQSPGGNIGPGRLPFPTREETILPLQLTHPWRNAVQQDRDGQVHFIYEGSDGRLEYRFDPKGGMPSLAVWMNGIKVGRLLDGGGVVLDGASRPTPAVLVRSVLRGSRLKAVYADGTEVALAIRQKSLLMDVVNRTGRAAELTFGSITGLHQPQALYVPPITYGSTNPSFLMCRVGKRTLFASIMPDWYRSNGSELYGAEYASGDRARINGGIRYIAKTDGRRNPLFERIFITVSPRFEEVLPVVPNPVGLHARMAVDRLWQESWGPSDYAAEMRRSEMLRSYGIARLIQCNHEIAWRDGGESFTLRVHAAPAKGGDKALQNFVAHQKALGWLSGLYTNYTDFAPVNEHWTPDGVQRLPDGEWRPAWPRCWAEKPMKAVEFEALLAPEIEKRYRSNSAYTDVSTAVAPWGYCDYDARVPGAGTFAQTFYCYGELLRNDSKVYRGPIFSEGTYQWLYAGLTDGNYGHTYNGRNLATEPLLPVFDLYQIHSKECDIGVSWTSFFCDAIPNWQSQENIDHAIDRFILTTMAYGHIGWLVEEGHGIGRTCRSYYMLQQVQARYGLQVPVRVAYWDGTRLRSVSQALVLGLPASRRQLYIEYANGLRMWLNDHPTKDWVIHAGSRRLVLPPAGWAAYQPAKGGHAHGLYTYSALVDGHRADYVTSDAYVYLDGRGRWFSATEAASSGALAIRKTGPQSLEVIHITGEDRFVVRRPYGVTGSLVKCTVYDAAGKKLASPVVYDAGSSSWITPVPGGVRYVLTFSGKRTWSLVPGAEEAAAGATVPVFVRGAPKARIGTTAGIVRDKAVILPTAVEPGSAVTVTARVGGAERSAVIRVCPPVEWQASLISVEPEATLLRLLPSWHLAGLPLAKCRIEFELPQGWSAEPQSLEFNGDRPPSGISLKVSSSAPAGARGDLVVTVRGMGWRHVWRQPLERAEERPILADVRQLLAGWGIARRGDPESTDVAGSGATCAVQDDLPVGGQSRKGIFMHPPYQGGVGYTWAELKSVRLPNGPCAFHSFIGLKDGGDPSDGVLFSVELVDAKGSRHVLASRMGYQKKWEELSADLSAYAGREVRLRLIADVGPADNSTADWACWGDPVIRRSTLSVVTRPASHP